MQHRHLTAPSVTIRAGARGSGAARRRAAVAGALLVFLFGAVPAHAELEFRALPDPSFEYLLPLDDTPNGLPRSWRLSPLQGSAANGYGEPTISVSVDPITGVVRESYQEQGVDLREPLVARDLDYNGVMTRRTTRRLWQDKFRNSRSIPLNATRAQGGLFRLELPVRLPKAVRSIVGEGAPNLEVTGSETITLSGKSDWNAKQSQYSSELKRPGAFPSFEMKQDLNVNLTGSIGDKIKVDVDQSTNVQTSLDNKVKLRYEGDDDDMIKTIELGNTNLSLQGASIRQEGLFGIKTAARLGNVDLVTIASKQEGKNETARFSPTGDRTHVFIRDLDYIKGQYFVIADHPGNFDLSKLEVWRDDLSYSDSEKSATKNRRGFGRLDPTAPADTLNNPEIETFWDRLTPEIDYTVSLEYWPRQDGLTVPVLRLTQPISQSMRLAVSYVETTGGIATPVGTSYLSVPVVEDPLLLKMIRPATSELPDPDADGFYNRNDPWYKVLPYELRNFYYLQANNISIATMTLAVRRLSGSEAIPPDNINGIPLIQILGLDQQNNTTFERGFDGKVDERYVDAERGILFFPDVNPFDPNDAIAPYAANACGPDTVGFLCLNDIRRNTLVRNTDPNLETANPFVYYRKTVDNIEHSRYVIDAELASSRSGYFLGRFGILEGSEQVRVNGVLKTRGTDYQIDYDTGQLTFLKPPGPDDPISVDYSFAGGAGQVQRTLAGFSASYSPSADRTVSSSFLYESKGAQEELVKLGEEPATSMIGDLSTVLAFRPIWMTQMVNRIPGIATSAPSTLNLQAGMSASVPNPNTRGEAYLDDMEGNRESNTLSLTRPQWIWSSIPSGKTNELATHAGIRWYNPLNAVKEHDLRPVLKDEEGGDASHQVLELSLLAPPTDSTGIMTLDDWNGVTQSLGTVGQDLTRVQYIDIWVNDFRQDHALTHAKLHLNFGRIDEDAFWDPNNPPNNLLDSEDLDHDGLLDKPTDGHDNPIVGEFEDTGLDGLLDSQEGTGPDPHGDNYTYSSDTNPNDYSTINNTEGNGTDPSSKPDTEDLNRDQTLDRENAYFEAEIDLSQNRFTVIDVPVLYADFDVVRNNPNNGWRLLRIPIADSTFTPIGAPSWSNIQAARIWVDGMTEPSKFQIGGIELTGNRWLRQAARDSIWRDPLNLPTMADRGVTLEVTARNNKDDAGVYIPPYDVKNAAGSTASRREQSLALVYKNLADRDTVFAFKTYSDPGNGFGWAGYQELRFWLHGHANVEAESLRAVARFGPDTLNFYEYSVPVRSGWQSIVIPMERLSGLKDRTGGRGVLIDRETGAGTGEVYAAYGNPSFTRVARVSFGLTVQGTPIILPDGEVWIDELRLSDVRKDRGISSNVTMQANFSDLLTLNGAYAFQDKDYFRVGTGATQGTGFDRTSLNLSSTVNLDRFIPSSGVVLPVSVSLQHSTDAPKFRTGSDVILDDARSKVETREFNRQSFGVSYRRSTNAKGFARYTVNAITTDMNYSKQGSLNPQGADSSWNFNSRVSYNVPIGGSGVRLGPLRVNPIPRTLLLQADWNSSRDVLYSRTLSDTADVRENRSDVKRRLLGLRMETSLEPLQSVRLTYRLVSNRDMLLHRQGGPFGKNIGTEIAHDQTVALNYKARWLTFLNPDFSLSGNYREQASTDRRDTPGAARLKDISNSGTFRTNLLIPISRLGGGGRAVRDTNGVFPLLLPMRFLFSRVQDISASFDMNRSAALTRVTGDPGAAFKSGFTEIFESDIRISPNSTFGSSRSYHGQGNTAIKPVERLTFQLRGDYLLSYSDQLYGERRSLTWSYPTVNASWSDLQRILGLNETLSSLTLTSTFDQQVNETGPKGGRFEQRVHVRRHTPLLGWNANFRSGVRVNAMTNFERSETEEGNSVGYLQSRTTKGTSIDVNKNFSAARGIKLPWKKTRVRLPSDLNLGAKVDLSTSKLVRQTPARDFVDSDTQSLRVNSNSSYNFSSSITGGFLLEYRQDRNKQLDDTRRGITVEFTGTFRF